MTQNLILEPKYKLRSTPTTISAGDQGNYFLVENKYYSCIDSIYPSDTENRLWNFRDPIFNDLPGNKNIYPLLEFVKNDFHFHNDDVIADYSTCLMWQRGGSESELSYEMARNYIKELNTKQFSGYSDWRLPTFEELLSLLEPISDSSDICIDEIFDKKQTICWSCDLEFSCRKPHKEARNAWIVIYSMKNLNEYGNKHILYDNFSAKNVYARAVRNST